MTAVFPGAHNTYVPSHGATDNMVVDYSRNVDDFRVNSYCQIRPVNNTVGYYQKMTVEERGRILDTSLANFEWADGQPAPEGNDGTESFEWLAYGCHRYAYPFNLGDLTVDQATWDIVAQHSGIKSQQAMTARTQLAVTLLSTSGNWAAAHTSAVSSISGVTGKWDVSTTARADIKKSLDYAADQIRIATLGAVKKKDLVLVISPGCARKMAASQELVDYLKGSPDALPWLQGKLSGEEADYELPGSLYGYKVVVEDAVKTTSRKGATAAKSYVLGDTTPFMVARPGALVANIPASAPSFSTCTLFMKEEMTVETKREDDHRRTMGRVVENYDVVLTSDISGFLFTAATD